MKSLLVILVLTVTMVSAGYAQQGVAINADGSPPNAKAMLDVKSTTKGLLIPRMTTNEKNNIAAPPEGLMVFDTDLKGFFYFKLGNWQSMTTGLDLPYNQTITFNGSALTIGNNQPSATAIAGEFQAGDGIGVQANGTIGGKFLGAAEGIYSEGDVAGKFYSAGTAGVIVDMNGNNLNALLVDHGMTGLGTLTPQSKLHVHDASMGNPANLLTVSGYAPNPDETISLVFKYQQPPVNGGPALPFFGMKSNHPLLFITNDDMDHPSMSIFNNKIGINKTDGTFPFSINGKTGIYEDDQLMGELYGNTTNGNFYINARPQTTNPFNAPENLVLQTRIDPLIPMGFVGINTPSPSAFLEVNKTGNNSATVAKIGRSNFDIGVYHDSTNIEGGFVKNSGGLSLNHTTSANVFIAGGGGDVMMINEDTKVCIGTTSKDERLNVKGTIKSEELVVATGWADYVFDDKYKLKTLEEVNDFIQQHKHLPGIPTALEIQAKGLRVAESSTKMMEKIEELTLYIIEQNNRLKKLEAEVNILKINNQP